MEQAATGDLGSGVSWWGFTTFGPHIDKPGFIHPEVNMT